MLPTTADLDGVMVDDVGPSVQGRRSGLLQLLRDQLPGLQRRRGRRATVRDGRGGLLHDPLLDFLLLLQRFDERGFQPIGVLGFQGLLLIGGHAVFAKDSATFGLVLPPPTREVGVALGAHVGVSDGGLGRS